MTDNRIQHPSETELFDVYADEAGSMGVLEGGYDLQDELPDAGSVYLPAYLRDSESIGVTYGELSYNRRTRQWSIKGDPVVCQMAKRLFPGSEGRGRDNVRFTAHKRIIGDLNWLMLRYPLSIRPQDRQKWEESLEEARQYALQ